MSKKCSLYSSVYSGTVSFNIHEIDGNIKLIITDTGIGIPKERLEKIGEPFFTIKEKGMGLGLTISNKIIHEHKGTLKINSELGKGTAVTITLPMPRKYE